MALNPTYSVGTVSVSAGGSIVTGIGTLWLAAGVQAGDIFERAGLTATIASVTSNTSLTLARAWPGTAVSGSSYEIRFTPDSTRVLASARQVVELLDGGNLPALSDLPSAGNMLPYFIGPGAAALTPITSVGREILAQATPQAVRAALGLTGYAGAGIRIQGVVANIGALPATGNTVGDAYLVGANLYVWGGSAPWVNAGSVTGPAGLDGVQIYQSRAAAAAQLPNVSSSVNEALVRNGSSLEVRSRTATTDDPLFTTSPQWGVVQRQDSTASNLRSVRYFGSRQAAIQNAADIPSNTYVIMTQEGTALVMRGRSNSSDDPLFDTEPYWGVVQRQDSAAEAVARSAALADKAAQADLEQEVFARTALLSPDGAGLTIGDPFGFLLAEFLSNGGLRTAAFDLSGTGDSFALLDPFGFVGLEFQDGVLSVMGEPVLPPVDAEYQRTGLMLRGSQPLMRWRGARARMLSGQGRARVLCLGDSNTAGDAVAPGVRLREAAYPARLAELLDRVYGASGDGFCGNAGILSAIDTTYDPRLSFGAGWVVSGAVSVGGTMFSNASTSNALTFTPRDAWERCEIIFAGIAAGAVDLSAGGATSRHDIPAGGMVSVSFDAGALASRQLSVMRVSGEIHVAAILPHSSIRPRVEVINAGRTGWASADLIDAATFYAPGAALSSVAADLVLIEIGLNDFNTGISPTVYGNRLRTLVGLCPVMADVVVMSSVSPEQASRVYPWSDYLDQMREVCAERELSFIDISVAMGDRSQVVAAGLTNDGLHPNRAGLAEKAHVASKLITF